MYIKACPTTPHTPKAPVTEKIFDREVRDDYRHLESDRPSRDEWLGAQVARTDCHIDALPNHAAIKERLLEAFGSQKKASKGGMRQGDGFTFQWSREEGAQYHKLTTFSSNGEEKVVFDPNSWPRGETLGWSTTSPDNRYLAYGRVINGMDVGRMEILDLKSGEVVRTLEGANSTLAPTWAAEDDKLYFTAKRNHPGFSSYDVSEGTVTQKATAWLAPYGDVAEYRGNVLYTTGAAKAYDEEAVFVSADGAVHDTEIPTGRMTFSSHGTKVFIQTTADAPHGKVLMLDMSQAAEGAAPAPTEVIPEEPGRKIDSITALDGAVAVAYSKNALPGLAVYDLEGKLIREVDLDGPGSLSGVKADEEGNLRFNWSTLVQPPVTKKLDMESGEISVVKEQTYPGFNPEEFTVTREWYTSADGTKVPITLAHRNDVELNGENPAHIYVYGGFRSGIEPYFSATRIPFLEAGGVYAIAHVRGGDELGDEWHDQATVLNRTKVYDDVAGAAKFLAEAGYSSAGHTSLEGASNGGLVTGVAITRNPELFDAAVAEVGLYDMARYEALGGHSWTQEYGTIGRKEEAEGLLSWSPYHNVREGVDYPAVLVTTGKHDDRVDPAHSFKFAARLQEEQTPDRPVFLRVEDSLGHGHGATDEQWADRYADQWAFLLNELGDVDQMKA